jgi:hypothetical protein
MTLALLSYGLGKLFSTIKIHFKNEGQEDKTSFFL